jgi:hypothetical protein
MIILASRNVELPPEAAAAGIGNKWRRDAIARMRWKAQVD